MDDSRVVRHIIVADFTIIEDTFIAVAYHTDLAIYRMMFNKETNTVISMMGPHGKVKEEFPISDRRLVHYYGSDIYDLLVAFLKGDK